MELMIMPENNYLGLFQMKSDNFDVAPLPGRRRGAYGVSNRLGFELKNVNTRHLFAMMVHQSNADPSDVLVELFHKKAETWNQNEYKGGWISLSMSDLNRLTIGTAYHSLLVEVNGRAFIKGLRVVMTNGLRPSYVLCHESYAHEFLRAHGNAIATALTYPDTVSGIAEGFEFNDCIRKINCFVVEMTGHGAYGSAIRRITESLADYRKDLSEEEEFSRKNHEAYECGISKLAQFGIEYHRREKERKQPLWP